MRRFFQIAIGSSYAVTLHVVWDMIDFNDIWQIKDNQKVFVNSGRS